jgi:hypothetical protein
MSPQRSAEELVTSVVELPGRFVEVASHDPLSAALLAVGAGLTFASVAVLGYLSLGAFVSLFTVESSRGPPRGGG